MEYYNTVTPQYLYQLYRGHSRYKIRVEILTSNETVIGEITKEISVSAQGQININYQQLVRRSCNLTLINVDRRFTPDANKWFWINKKFKLWIGMASESDIWWFAQGVYYTKSAHGDAHELQIEGIDKGGALDGSLKLNMLDGKYVIEQGSNIVNLVKHTLGLSDKVNVLDPVAPIIDMKFNNAIIQKQIELADGNYIGELFSNIAESYMSDVYYDVNGRFRLEPCLGDIYETQFDFTDDNAKFGEANVEYGYDVVNAVTVYTNINAKDSNNQEINNVSYTAYNNSPLSPINIKSIGIRKMESIEAAYIDGLTEKEMTERCKQTANYYLLKEGRLKLSIGFTSVIIPHLDVNKAINIKRFGMEDSEKYIVQSIIIPLTAGNMSIQAVSVNDLPRDIDIERGVR
jgi:hypothetical protein